MLRSLYSGISGMKNFQTKLDVIGNNIANVNTYGFKKSRVTFSDTMNQTIAGASAATANLGGKNSLQVGLGSSISTIDTIDTNSSMQTTNRSLDLAIDGDGYFVVKDGASNFYTRAGNLYLDEEAKLVTSDGLKVQGYKGDANTGATGDITIGGAADTTNPIVSFSISQTGEINAVRADGIIEKVGTIAVATFSNASGLTKAGSNTYQESVNSGEAVTKTAGDGRGTIASGFLEMSNVDLSEEFTDMIIAQRGFQANSRIITTSDQILEELVNLKR